LVRQKALASLISTPEIPATPSTEEDEKFLSRIIREWDPDYISLACPFVAATLIGPSSANISVACDQAAQHSPNGSSRYLEIFKLVLARIGEYWEIGSSVLSTYIDISYLFFRSLAGCGRSNAYNSLYRTRPPGRNSAIL
jgi:hypothetical protein